MTQTPEQEEFQRLYQAAIKADERFHAEVVRQFGKKRAGDMRYRSNQHDAQTSLAADCKHAADDALRAAWPHNQTQRFEVVGSSGAPAIRGAEEDENVLAALTVPVNA